MCLKHHSLGHTASRVLPEAINEADNCRENAPSLPACMMTRPVRMSVQMVVVLPRRYNTSDGAGSAVPSATCIRCITADEKWSVGYVSVSRGYGSTESLSIVVWHAQEATVAAHEPRATDMPCGSDPPRSSSTEQADRWFSALHIASTKPTGTRKDNLAYLDKLLRITNGWRDKRGLSLHRPAAHRQGCGTAMTKR